MESVQFVTETIWLFEFRAPVVTVSGKTMLSGVAVWTLFAVSTRQHNFSGNKRDFYSADSLNPKKVNDAHRFQPRVTKKCKSNQSRAARKCQRLIALLYKCPSPSTQVCNTWSSSFSIPKITHSFAKLTPIVYAFACKMSQQVEGIKHPCHKRHNLSNGWFYLGVFGRTFKHLRGVSIHVSLLS